MNKNICLQDFWSMVWQERSTVIVMLTQTFECIQVMCAQYWPNKLGRTEKFGEFAVTLVQEDTFSHYKVNYFFGKYISITENILVLIDR